MNKSYLLTVNSSLQLKYIENILKENINDKFELSDNTLIFNTNKELNDLRDIFYKNNNCINDFFLIEISLDNKCLMTKNINDFLFVNSNFELFEPLNKESIIKKINNEGIDSLSDEELNIMQN